VERESISLQVLRRESAIVGNPDKCISRKKRDARGKYGARRLAHMQLKLRLGYPAVTVSSAGETQTVQDGPMEITNPGLTT
jgi:hypothetical protein